MTAHELYEALDRMKIKYEVVEMFEGARFLRIEVEEEDEDADA